MSKPKAPSLPSTPEYIQGPEFAIAKGLTSGAYFNQPEGAWLRDTISMNPDMTRLTLEGLKAQLAPQLRNSRQEVINQLEANNQLTGSTTASALGNIQSDYESQLVNAGAQAGIADINRALSNRVALFGAGLNTLQSDTQNQNQFNLENYQNQVAKVLGEQKSQRGGLMGALTGGVGGAITGMALAPLTGGSSLMLAGLGGVGGAAAGGFGPQGTGGALFQTGAGLAGSRLGNNYSNSGRNIFPSLGNATSDETLSGGLRDAFRQTPYYV